MQTKCNEEIIHIFVMSQTLTILKYRWIEIM